MKAPLLVDALRTRDPGARGALYDTHGENLFRYCWFILGNSGAAQVALRDTLVVAEAHIGRLQDPQLLRPWLFALARAECLRRQQSPGTPRDAVVARPDQPDAGQRLVAWHAVLSLFPLEREALELTLRHGMDAEEVALVLALSFSETESLLERAGDHLEQALAAEILARHGVHSCAERVEALRGWAGDLTVALRERLVGHARSCRACERYLPRNVSASKVFGLLPVPAPPQAMRMLIMTCFTDPELVGYRMFVAARADQFDELGFPDPGQDVTPAPRPNGGKWRAGLAVAAAVVAVLIATVFVFSRLGDSSIPVQGVSSASGAQANTASAPAASGSGTSPSSGTPGASPGPHLTVVGPGLGTAGPTPLYLRGSRVSYRPSASGLPAPGSGHPVPSGQLRISPSQLSLGTGSTGQITLQAAGGPVTWSAGTSSPQVSLSSAAGTLQAGQQVTLTVSVTRARAVSGQATISFSPGGGSVMVTWTDPTSSSPPPQPPPSPSPTVLPSSPRPSRTPTSPPVSTPATAPQPNSPPPSGPPGAQGSPVSG